MSKHVGEKCGKWADGDRTDGESDGRTDGQMDGRTDGDPDGDPDGHHHTIIRPVWRQAYKKATWQHKNATKTLITRLLRYNIWIITNIIKNKKHKEHLKNSLGASKKRDRQTDRQRDRRRTQWLLYGISPMPQKWGTTPWMICMKTQLPSLIVHISMYHHATLFLEIPGCLQHPLLNLHHASAPYF